MEEESISSEEIAPSEENKENNENSTEIIANTSIDESKSIDDSIISEDLNTTLDDNILHDMGLVSEKKADIDIYKTASKIKSDLDNDINKVEKLIQCGMLNPNIGKNLKKQILQNAFDKIVATEKSIQKPDKNKIFEEFNKKSPDFFTHEGRKDVLNYLQNEVSNIGEQELNKISEIIKIVEKSAISRYLQKSAHEKSLKVSNEQAKQKLTANAQSSSDGINLSQTFTREQIGKMTCSEFAKYEKTIMKQLRDGRIK